MTGPTGSSNSNGNGNGVRVDEKKSIIQTLEYGIKKVIMESFSVKFWGAVYLGYANWHIIKEDNRFDFFGIAAFIALLGVREYSKFLDAKIDQWGAKKQ